MPWQHAQEVLEIGVNGAKIVIFVTKNLNGYGMHMFSQIPSPLKQQMNGKDNLPPLKKKLSRRLLGQRPAALLGTVQQLRDIKERRRK